MAIGHHQYEHYEHQPYHQPYEDAVDPASSAAAFIAALGFLLIVFLVVVLLWAPWSRAADTTGSNPTLTQPVQVQPVAPVQPQSGGGQTLPSAPRNPGSSSGR